MTQVKQKKNKLRFVNLSLFCLLVVFSASYLWGTSDASIKSYILGQKKKEANKIKNTNNELELRAMSLSSYNNLSKKLADLKMVKVDKIDYINGVTSVALIK